MTDISEINGRILRKLSEDERELRMYAVQTLHIFAEYREKPDGGLIRRFLRIARKYGDIPTPTPIEKCSECVGTSFEKLEAFRICTQCFAQEDIPTMFLDYGDDTRVNLHREYFPQNPRKPKKTLTPPVPPISPICLVPMTTKPEPRPLPVLQLTWKDIRKKAPREAR